MLNLCDFIQVYVFTTNHHLYGPLRQYFSLYRAVSQREVGWLVVLGLTAL